MSDFTNARFAQQAAFISENAASWAAGLLTLPERLNQSPRPEQVARFVADMRGRLDIIEEWAAEAPTAGDSSGKEAGDGA